MRRLSLAALAVASLAIFAAEAPYQITPEAYLDHIKFLASPELAGRGTGTPGLEKAAQYIEHSFRRSGLHGIPKAGLEQPFTVTLNAHIGSENSLEIKTSNGLEKLKIKNDFEPFPFSASGTFSGPLVFAGYGITAPEYHYDDYAGIDVKGKIVILLRHEPQEYDAKSVFAGRNYTEHAVIFSKATNAKQHGAIAVLFVNEAARHNGKDELEPFQADSGPTNAGIGFVQIHTAELDHLLAPMGESSGRFVEEVDKDLKPHSFALAPEIQVKLQVEVVREHRTVENVTAYLPGHTDEYIIIGAHYDHLGLGGEGSLAPSLKGTPHLGADDNASGTSGVLELAHYFASRPKMKRSLLFITFAGEELGLLGSSYWANHPELPLDKAVAMVNMDMIGRIRDGKVTVGGVTSGSTLKEILDKTQASTPLHLDAGDGPSFGSSDHISFISKQIPSLFFFSGLHADYHKPSDTWDKIDAPDAVKLLGSIAEVVTQLADRPDRPQFRRVAVQSSENPHGGGEPPAGSATDSGGGGYGPSFGSVPDFEEPPTGVRFADVREGTPAAKAGLRAKDILIEFDGKQIGNLYDFTYVLRSKKAGDKVHVRVLRNGQPVEADVLLEERR